MPAKKSKGGGCSCAYDIPDIDILNMISERMKYNNGTKTDLPRNNKDPFNQFIIRDDRYVMVILLPVAIYNKIAITEWNQELFSDIQQEWESDNPSYMKITCKKRQPFNPADMFNGRARY